MTIFSQTMEGLSIQKQNEAFHVFWYAKHVGTIMKVNKYSGNGHEWEWHSPIVSRFLASELVKAG